MDSSFVFVVCITQYVVNACSYLLCALCLWSFISCSHLLCALSLLVVFIVVASCLMSCGDAELNALIVSLVDARTHF